MRLIVTEPGKKDKRARGRAKWNGERARERSTVPSFLLTGPGWCILSDMHACHFCGTIVENPREVYRSTSCPTCGKDLKICLNCRFYSPGAHWDCAESIDELVKDKDRANFCTFFSFRAAAAPGSAAPPSDAKQQAKRKLDKLFGNDA
jgi:hypothetical protein